MTPFSPRIAVALAAYNGMEYLAEQVESIFRQEGVFVTLFISVDRSADGTEEWVRALVNRDRRVVMLPIGQRFGGASANFFRLLRELDLSGFDCLAFSDQDDIWLSNKLARAHQLLVEKNSDGYSSNVTAFWPSGKQSLVYKASPQRRWDYLFESAGPGCTYLMRRTLVVEMQKVARNQAELLSKVVYHDWFAYAYARANGFKWVIDDYSGMLYRQHNHNQLGANTGFSSFLRRFEQVRSGEATEQVRLIMLSTGGHDSGQLAALLDGGRLQMLKLAMSARQCRRKLRDQVYFFASCILCAVVRPSKLKRR
jgi:rhamnosyltransferase